MKLIYHPRAVKFLRKLPQKEAERVLSKIELIKTTPSQTNLDIKKLTTTKRTYRLRVGNIRVIYEIDPTSEMIYIHEIDFRGNIY
ncbi:hypothetical protein A2W14_04860 [Candidatus Gottesmanbacteria bacterium RBG_16_37_8]|uniref:Plasmid stabilization protein n=1 Tax=Candidatus Gottesmanbacteria bacterium RBG_16_37_8 TaxID=1798371 RepID=A0A1F5YUT8_9BACT|nr:MAG: hypothetical protein A2W14_04860 [Candidatus Gottesmanbacteria bacterium RBG_16_37_8]